MSSFATFLELLLSLHPEIKFDTKKMNEIEIIHSKIYEIRELKVMLDRDLAEMYGVETRALNQAVKRNADRFPEDFMFQMTDEEVDIWKSQIVISNSIKMGMRRNPYVFTELGVAMLSSVLTSKPAIQVNIGIMRAFVAIRQMISPNPVAMRLATLEKNFEELKQDLEEIFTDYNDINEDTRAQLDAINIALADLQSTRRKSSGRRRIGFKTEN